MNTKLMNTQKLKKLSEDQKDTLLRKTTPKTFLISTKGGGESLQ